MRVAFSGVSGTGKTTLAKRLAEHLDLPFCPIGSRSVAVMMGFTGSDGEGRPYDVDSADLTAYTSTLRKKGHEDLLEHPVYLLAVPVEDAKEAALEALRCWGGGTTSTVRPLFQRTLQAAKIAWETQHRDFVTDRATIDDMAYLAASPGGMAAVDMEYVNRALEHTRSYDLVFFAPIAAFQKIGDDPARIQAPGYHALQEMLMVGGLQAAVRPGGLHTLPGGSLEARWAFVLAQMQFYPGWTS